MANPGNGVASSSIDTTPKFLSEILFKPAATRRPPNRIDFQTKRKRRKQPSTSPLITTTENAIIKILFEQIGTRPTTKSGDDLPSMIGNNQLAVTYFTSSSTTFPSTITEELFVTEDVEYVEASIPVKPMSVANNETDKKSETFRKASFFPSKNPSNVLNANWITLTILITASPIFNY